TSAAANPHLTTAVAGNGFAAIWLDDAGHPVSLSGILPMPDAVLAGGETTNPTGPWSMVSAAISGTTLLVAVGSTDTSVTGNSTLHAYDARTGSSIAPSMNSQIRIASPRGL